MALFPLPFGTYVTNPSLYLFESRDRTLVLRTVDGPPEDLSSVVVVTRPRSICRDPSGRINTTVNRWGVTQ